MSFAATQEDVEKAQRSAARQISHNLTYWESQKQTGLLIEVKKCNGNYQILDTKAVRQQFEEVNLWVLNYC